MYGLLYFDVEDFFSPPDAPVHRFPARIADMLTRRGFPGCFHVHGEKARFMERHGQADVIEALARHDVSLHSDRGSIPPSTAEEVSRLGWFEGLERVMLREAPGFQTIDRLFGKCSSLTRHGGNWAPQIVVASGRLGRPYFDSPLRHPSRSVFWYGGNLAVSGSHARLAPDGTYREDATADKARGRMLEYVEEQSRKVDFAAVSGGHVCRMLRDEIPEVFYFSYGRVPRANGRLSMPEPRDISYDRVLENLERLVEELAKRSDVEWTDVAGISRLYGKRPVRVSEHIVEHAARKVLNQGGPAYTNHLSAAEALYLMAVRHFAPSDSYEVPMVMGPVCEPKEDCELATRADLDQVARGVLRACEETGYLPTCIETDAGRVTPASALALLSCQAAGRAPVSVRHWNLSINAMPGVEEGAAILRTYSNWRCFSPAYDWQEVRRFFRLQCWTLKPAMPAHEYPEGVELGTWDNAMLPSTWRDPSAFVSLFDEDV